MTKLLPLVTPGEILEHEFMVPLGLSQNELGRCLHVSPTAIGQIMKGDRAITPAMALRLSAYFGTTPEFWLNMQQSHDLALERQKHGAAIMEAVKPRSR